LIDESENGRRSHLKKEGSGR